MILDRNENKDVAVLLGAGSMGMAILRRVAAGKKILLGGRRQSSLDEAAENLRYSGYDVETFVVDAVDPVQVRAFAEKAASLGPVKIFIDTAGASPSQASPEEIIKLDLIGTAYALDIFGEVMAPGGAGVIISSMTGYMPHHLTPEDRQNHELRHCLHCLQTLQPFARPYRSGNHMGRARRSDQQHQPRNCGDSPGL